MCSVIYCCIYVSQFFFSQIIVFISFDLSVESSGLIVSFESLFAEFFFSQIITVSVLHVQSQIILLSLLSISQYKCAQFHVFISSVFSSVLVLLRFSFSQSLLFSFICSVFPSSLYFSLFSYLFAQSFIPWSLCLILSVLPVSYIQLLVISFSFIFSSQFAVPH